MKSIHCKNCKGGQFRICTIGKGSTTNYSCTNEACECHNKENIMKPTQEEKIKEILGIYNGEILNKFQDEYLMQKGPGCENVLFPVLQKSIEAVMSKHEGDSHIYKTEILDLFQEYGDFIRQQTLEEAIGGKIDIIKLIEYARCPHPDCDNKGTIAERVSEDEWEPAPCQWCFERKQTLSNLQELKNNL